MPEARSRRWRGARRTACTALLAGAALLCAHDWRRPEVLLVGDVTVDRFAGPAGRQGLGGAVSYAAAVLSAYGVRACVLTAAGPGADLAIFEGHDLTAVPAAATLTFEHSYTWWGHKRVLRLTQQPGVTLTAAHAPPRCRRARTILLGPLTPADIDVASFVDLRHDWLDALVGFRQRVGLMAQGLQRGVDATKKVVPFQAPSSALLAALGPRTVVFLSDVETDAWPAGTVEQLAQRGGRWLVTKGEFGADEYTAGRPVKQLPPEKVPRVADTNGAGDTFGTAYMLGLAGRCPSPGGMANWAASRAVTQPQDCKPTCVGTAIGAAGEGERRGRWCGSPVGRLRQAAEERLGAWRGSLGELWGPEAQQRLGAALSWARAVGRRGWLRACALVQEPRPPAELQLLPASELDAGEPESGGDGASGARQPWVERLWRHLGGLCGDPRRPQLA